MATTTLGNILDRATTVLQDTTNTRWPQSELVGWINDSYKEIVLLKPDANTQSSTVSLAAGTRQKLADAGSINLPSALLVIDVPRNMAALSDKGVIRHIKRQILDDQVPTWHNSTQSVNIKHWIFDDRVPKEFFVYPPAAAGAQVEIIYSSVPTGHSTTTVNTADTIKVDDIYGNVLLDYVLYRAYSKDAEYAANGGRAQGHRQSFAEALGAKEQIETAQSAAAVAPAVTTVR
jgi:hypothetical protein